MTLIRHELKRAWKSTTIWTCAIGAFIVICLFMYPDGQHQLPVCLHGRILIRLRP